MLWKDLKEADRMVYLRVLWTAQINIRLKGASIRLHTFCSTTWEGQVTDGCFEF